MPKDEYEKMSQNAINYVIENYNYEKIVSRINFEMNKQIDRYNHKIVE